MAIKINGTTVVDDNRNVVNIDGLTVPSGTTAERPASPSTGEIRYNTDDSALEQYDGSSWSAVGPDAISVPITNKRVISNSGTSIAAGDLVSYKEGTSEITKTLGDPINKSIAGNESDDTVYLDTCGTTVSHPPIGLNDFIRTGPETFFKISKGGTTGLTQDGADTCDLNDVIINCWGVQTFSYNSTAQDLDVVDNDFFTECPSSTDPKQFDFSQWNVFERSNIPFNSLVSLSGFSDDEEVFPFVRQVIRTSTDFTLCCCSNCDDRVYLDGNYLPSEYTTGAMTLFSNDDSSLYYIVNVLPYAEPKSGDECIDAYGREKVGADNDAYYPGGFHGIQLYKFDYCDGTDLLCTVPSRYECSICGEWNLGYINKSGTLMYGECSNLSCLCEDSNNNDFIYGEGQLFVRDIDDNFCLDRTYGLVSGTDREFLHSPVKINSNTTDEYSLGQKKFWPGTEDDNGWILWSEPVMCMFTGDSNDVYQIQGSFLRIGAIKPISTGCAIESNNVVCVCYNAANDGAFLIAGYDGVNGCSFDTVPNDLDNAIGGGSNAGDPFGCFAFFTDAHAITSTHGIGSLADSQFEGVRAVPACKAYTTDECLCHFLPQATAIDGWYEESNSVSGISFVPFWVTGDSNYCIGESCGERIGSTFGSSVGVKFCIDDSTCDVTLVCCDGPGSFQCMTNIATANFNQDILLDEFYSPLYDSYCWGEDRDIEEEWEFYTTKFLMTEERPLPSCGGPELCMQSVIFSGSNASDLSRSPSTCPDFFSEKDDYLGITCFSNVGLYSFWNVGPDAYRYELFHKRNKFNDLKDTRYQVRVSDLDCYGPGFRSCNYKTDSATSGCVALSRNGSGTELKFQEPLYISGGYLAECVCQANFNIARIVEKCQADNSTISDDTVNDFYSDVPFLPQQVYNVGENNDYLFIGTVGTSQRDSIEVSVASEPNQNNAAFTVGIASEDGDPGDIISFATVDQGTAPVPSIYSNCCYSPYCRIEEFYNGSSNCFSCVHSSYGIVGFGCSCVIDTYDNVDIYLCMSYDPETDCCTVYLTKE